MLNGGIQKMLLPTMLVALWAIIRINSVCGFVVVSNRMRSMTMGSSSVLSESPDRESIKDLAHLLKRRDSSIRIEEFSDIVKQAPNISIPYERIAELKLMEAERIACKPTPAKLLHAKASQDACKLIQRHKHDHGSPEVQVVVAHEKIKYLTKHCIDNRFDYASKRGLQSYVNLRRKMLNYLYLHGQHDKALSLAKSLNIRFSPPGQQHLREVKYKFFKNTKQVKRDSRPKSSMK